MDSTELVFHNRFKERLIVGTLATGGADGQRYFDMGYTFVGMGSDSGLLKNGTRDLAQAFK